jgi:hypothetical protein
MILWRIRSRESKQKRAFKSTASLDRFGAANPCRAPSGFVPGAPSAVAWHSYAPVLNRCGDISTVGCRTVDRAWLHRQGGIICAVMYSIYVGTG